MEDLENLINNNVIQFNENIHKISSCFLEEGITALNLDKKTDAYFLLKSGVEMDIDNEECRKYLQVLLYKGNYSLEDLLQFERYLPLNWDILISIATLYRKSQNFKESYTYLQRLYALADNKNKKVQIFSHIAQWYYDQNLQKQSYTYAVKALLLDAFNSEMLNLKAVILLYNGFSSDAINVLNLCLKLNPNNSTYYLNLGLPYAQLQDFKKSREMYYKCLELDPSCYLAYQNLLLDTHCDTDINKEEVFNLHKKVDDFIFKDFNNVVSSSIREINSNKRIGIISADLSNHPVSYFIKTLIEMKEDLIIFADCIYAKERVVNIAGLSNEQVEDLIRKNNIDVLIDLSVHTGKNRIMALRSKPAPIIINYLGYPDTSGSKIYDYRMIDRITDPDWDYMTEKPLSFEKSFLCYDGSHINQFEIESPETKTFISCNRMQKVNEKVLRLYKRVLEANAGSKIIFKNKEIVNQSNKDFILKYLPADRVIFVSYFENAQHSYEFYNKASVLLDTFPYNGTCTTCDALYCGVPVLTLKGDRHCARVSESILRNSNLSEWVAEDEEEFVRKSRDLVVNKNEIRDKFRNGFVCNKEIWYADFQRLMHSI